MGKDRIDTMTMQDWGGTPSRPAHAATLTLDNIPVVGPNSNRLAKPLEIPERVVRFGMALLAAASLYGGAEASIHTSTGRHAHEVLGDLVELGMAEFGIETQASNFRNP